MGKKNREERRLTPKERVETARVYTEKLALKMTAENKDGSVAAGHTSGQKHAHKEYKEGQKESGGTALDTERASQNSESLH